MLLPSFHFSVFNGKMTRQFIKLQAEKRDHHRFPHDEEGLGTESMGEVVVLSENVASIIMRMKSSYK